MKICSYDSINLQEFKVWLVSGDSDDEKGGRCDIQPASLLVLGAQRALNINASVSGDIMDRFGSYLVCPPRFATTVKAEPGPLFKCHIFRVRHAVRMRVTRRPLMADPLIALMTPHEIISGNETEGAGLDGRPGQSLARLG